jgi:hypothetical protein
VFAPTVGHTLFAALPAALVYRRELVARFRTPVPAVDQTAQRLSMDEMRSRVERASVI